MTTECHLNLRVVDCVLVKYYGADCLLATVSWSRLCFSTSLSIMVHMVYEYSLKYNGAHGELVLV